MRYSAKFSTDRRNVAEIHGRFSIFQDGGRPPSWIYQKWPTLREPILAASKIGSWWSHLTLVQKWCLWNNLNNRGVWEIKPSDYTKFGDSRCFSRSGDMIAWLQASKLKLSHVTLTTPFLGVVCHPKART